MRRLLACSCLTPILILPTALRAETTIETKRTTGAATATIKSGARDDLRITSTGSIELTSGTAVTLDSANSVKNEGTISFKDTSDATGILGAATGAGDITNSGKIVIDETYAASDTDKDGDLDGPFSNQARNAGIRTAGAFAGNVVNSGSITIKGNQSSGIALAGPLTGGLTHSGSIDVLGDGAVGIQTNGVTGHVKVLGAVNVQGAGAVAVAVDGPIGGQLLIQNLIAATGYRTTTPPADVSKLDPDDLLQGGPAVRVTGSVAGGVLFDIRPKDTDPKDDDEDKDGIEDAKEGNAAVASYGEAPAVQIGGSTAINIGAVAGNAQGFGVVVNGDVLGSGVYKGVSGTGVQIGGAGGTVAIAGGIAINGSVTARSLDANATALRIGAGGMVPKLHVGGTVAATSGTGAAGEVLGVSIESGGSLPALANTGVISAASTGDGTAVAIRDRSNTLAAIDNTGVISAASKKAAVDSAVAIDLQTSTVGVTLRQNAVAANATAPKIVGAVLFGSGDDVFEVGDGTVVGTTRFGAGNNRLGLSGDAVVQGDVSFGTGADTVTLGGTSVLAGALDFGGGADALMLAGTSRFTGTIANGSGAAVTVTGGTLDLRNTGAVSLARLDVSGAGTIGITIDPATHSATRYEVGAASFAQGAKLAVSVANVGSAEGDYVIVKAGTLAGGANLAATSASLPFMFKGSVAADDAAGQVSLKVQRKSIAELELSRSQASAYDAVFKVLDKDSKVAGVFLNLREQAAFQDAVQQMLPDHAGGVFDTVTRGSRTLGSYIADPDAMVADLGAGLGFWLQQAVWGTSKARGETAGYRTSGWGASGGIELNSGIGKFGASLAYLNGSTDQRRVDQRVDSNQYEAALHWRNGWGGFHAYARASAALVDLAGSRKFVGVLGTGQVTRTATAEWNGRLYSVAAGLSYQLRTGRLTIRPAAAIDYYRLHENAHADTGGGDAFNLWVAARTSDELAATGTLAAGYDLSTSADGFMRLELEGGRREIVGGSLGNTVAGFKDGTGFTLLADARQSGWLGKLRLTGGGETFRIGGEASVEQQNGRAAVGVRATLSVGF